jgi:2-(1,2-epoxy-1,2-dihydrophenyl)acetyl-CoA isomerase
LSTKYEASDDIAVITLDRPDRYNAIDADLSRSMVANVARAEGEARVIVITGAGKAFCSGADLSGFAEEYAAGSPDLGRHLDEEFHPVVHALSECSLPTIAAINGVAAGAGMGMALGCDLRVMDPDAYFTSAFTAIGLAPDSGSTWLLPHHVGVSTALEMALTNRKMGADEALGRGLCVEISEPGASVGLALDYARRMADMPTDALVTTRRLIRGSAGLTFDQGLEHEKAEQTRLGKTPEHAEGVAAFLEKRKPNFRKF